MKLLKSSWKKILALFNGSIKYKTIFVLTVSMIVPLIVVTAVSFVRSSNSMEQQIIVSNTGSIKTAGNFMNKSIKQLNDVLFTLLVDGNVYTIINQIGIGDVKTEYSSIGYIQNKLSSIHYSNNSYNGLIVYFDKTRQLFYESVEKNDYISGYDATKQGWYKFSRNSFGGEFINNDRFLPKGMDFGINEKMKSFVVLRSIREFVDKGFIGVVMMSVRWNIMDDILATLKGNDSGQFLVIDPKGNIVYNPYHFSMEAEKLKKISSLIHNGNPSASYIKDKEFSLFYSEISENSLYVIKVIPNSYINKNAQSTLKISILIILLSLVVCIVLAYAASYGTTKPIIRLSKSMKGIKENLTDGFQPSGRQDEIGVLEQSYAYMIERIKSLIENEYKIKVEKRTAQLKALQAQINPHFLNNTLQLIGGIALSKNVPEIYTIIKAISNMFNYSIKMPEEMVLLKQEIQNIQDYLLIQQLRFSDKLQITYELDEAYNHCILPKLTLQPIVENCFKHGFEKKTEDWKIRIQILRQDQLLQIIIEDNGTGISPEVMQRINTELDNNLNNLFETKSSIGVKNVDARIKLHFGYEYGVKITSSPEAGTSVRILIPISGKEQE